MTGSPARPCTPTRTPARGALALVLGLASTLAGCGRTEADGSCEDALDRLFLLGTWTTTATAGERTDGATPDWFREAARTASDTCPPSAESSVYGCIAGAADLEAMKRCVHPTVAVAFQGRPGHGAEPGTDAAYLAQSRLPWRRDGDLAGAPRPPSSPAIDASIMGGVAGGAPAESGVALAALAGIPVARPEHAARSALPRPEGSARLEARRPALAAREAMPRRLVPDDAVPSEGAGEEEADEDMLTFADAPSDRAVAVAVQARRRAFHRCYAGLTQGLSSPPRVAYDVRLRLREDGSVADVDVASRRGDVPRLRACVQAVASRLSFDGRFRGEPAIEFPLIFSPGS